MLRGTLSRYRTANDFKPYIFKTTRLRQDVEEPERPPSRKDEITRTIREDTEFARVCSSWGPRPASSPRLTTAEAWQRINVNLPRVGVHDMKIKDERPVHRDTRPQLLDPRRHQPPAADE